MHFSKSPRRRWKSVYKRCRAFSNAHAEGETSIWKRRDAFLLPQQYAEVTKVLARIILKLPANETQCFRIAGSPPQNEWQRSYNARQVKKHRQPNAKGSYPCTTGLYPFPTCKGGSWHAWSLSQQLARDRESPPPCTVTKSNNAEPCFKRKDMVIASAIPIISASHKNNENCKNQIIIAL